MKARAGIELKLFDYLVGKSLIDSLFNVQSIANRLNYPLEELKNTLNKLEKENVIHFIGDNYIELSPDFKEEVRDFAKIYRLVEGIPEFKTEFSYFAKPEVKIITPFKDADLDNIFLEVIKENEKLYIQVSPFELIYLEHFTSNECLKELGWRLDIEVGSKEQRTSNGETVKIPYLRKQTSVESFINDLYKVINAYLFIEGARSKEIFKPATKEELIDAIVNLIGQGIFSGYIDVELYIKHSIAEEEEKLYKQLQNKTEEQLWQMLEEKAKEVIPVIDGKVDSLALSAFKNALLLLASKGKFNIEYKGGRRVIGQWKEEGQNA